MSTAAAAECGYPSGAMPDLVLRPRESDAVDKPSATVIFSHGLGDTSEGFGMMLRQWQLQDPRLARVRFVLPTAPNMPVTLNGGMRMPAWYDLKGLGERDNESCDGIDGSAKRIGDLIAKEVASGVPENRIVLGGFSQGGALSLFSGLSHKRDVAGILVMSGYLPRGSKAAEFVRVSDVPVFHIHGDADPVVIPNWAQQTETALKGLGVKYSRKMFAGMQHEVRRDAESAAREWIIETLGLKAEGK